MPWGESTSTSRPYRGAVLAVFGDEARHFVFIGGCVLGL